MPHGLQRGVSELSSAGVAEEGRLLVAGQPCCGLLFVATAAPAPLYRRLSGSVAVLGDHADRGVRRVRVVLLVTLLMFGSVSDHFGRRRNHRRWSRGIRGGVRRVLGCRRRGRPVRREGAPRVSRSAWPPVRWGRRCWSFRPERSGLAPPVTSAGPDRSGSRSAGRGKRAGPVRAGAHPSRLVVAVGRGSRLGRGGAGDAGVEEQARSRYAPVVSARACASHARRGACSSLPCPA